MARKSQNEVLNAPAEDITAGLSEPKKEGKKMATFTLFAEGGRGKKSTNAPCVVNYEPIAFDSLSDEQKTSLVDRLIKDTARKEYYERSKGYRMLESFLKAAREMMTAMGLEPTEDQVKAAAVLLAKRDEVTLAFEPVVEITLTADEVLNAKDSDESGAEENKAE